MIGLNDIQTVKRITDAGHEIGNHSDTHPHVAQMSKESLKEIMTAHPR